MKNKMLRFLALTWVCSMTICTLKAQVPQMHPDSLPQFVVDAKNDTVFRITENAPEFPEGQLAMFKFLGNNVRYPVLSRESGAQGTAYIAFVVNTDGSITDIKEKFFSKIESTKRFKKKVPEQAYKDLVTEAIRVVRLMPKWKVGSIKSRPVRVAFTLPIKFKLE
jgi:periplasmic protein TonB